MPTKMQVLTTVTVATFLSVVCAFCLMSAMSITFIVPARRKELSTPTLAVSKKKKKKMLKGNGVDGYDIKRGDVIDRIDVYNQYDEENIEIDEQPVSREFTVRILATLNRSFIEQLAKAISVYSSKL